jgi:small subunit ribosomal protein S18
MKQSRPSRPRIKSATLDLEFSYKDVDALKRFVTEQGYLLGRAKTGLNQKAQRRLARAVKRARHLALLPFTQTV